MLCLQDCGNCLIFSTLVLVGALSRLASEDGSPSRR